MNRRPRRSRLDFVVVLLTVALVACETAPSAAPRRPSGALGAIAQRAAELHAPNANLGDQYFEDFLASLDLRNAYGDRANEIAEQLRKTRAAVAVGRKPTSGAAAPRFASLAAAPDAFSLTVFGQTLADSLDPMTKTSATRESKPNPYGSAEDGPTATTTTTLNVTDIFSSAGSRVTLTEHWSYKMTTKDKASGATLVDSTEEHSIVGVIDLCPDAAGSVSASLNVHSQSSATRGAVGSTRSATSSNVFAGTVDDNAVLRTVRQTLQERSEWEAPTGNGGFDANLSASYAAGSSGSLLGGMDGSSVTGSFNATGNGAETVSKSVAWTLAIDAYALDGAYQSAQKLWRNGRCVMVQAQDYNAETPIDVASQQTSQHDEEVDVSSETKFSVNLKHRFAGGALNHPVTSSLTNGAKALEPNRLGSVPASLTYKASDEEDRQATAELKSTSKRGIGTLVLTFRTTGAQLRMEMKGTSRTTLPGAALQYVGSYTMGPIDLLKRDATTYAGTGPMTLFLRVEGLPFPCEVSFSGNGRIAFLAALEKRSDETVWVIRADELASNETLTTSSCVGGAFASYSPGEGGWGLMFARMAGNVVVPRAGGAAAVHGSINAGGYATTMEGTLTATVTKK